MTELFRLLTVSKKLPDGHIHCSSSTVHNHEDISDVYRVFAALLETVNCCSLGCEATRQTSSAVELFPSPGAEALKIYNTPPFAYVQW
jgi:hypothetical protein